MIRRISLVGRMVALRKLLVAILILQCGSCLTAWGQVAVPQRVRVSSRVMGELIIKKVAPRYPEAARQGRVQGTIMLTALISKTGDVVDLQLISGPPELVQASMDAVKQWKYKPYLLQGEAVEVETTVQVNFTLAYR